MIQVREQFAGLLRDLEQRSGQLRVAVELGDVAEAAKALEGLSLLLEEGENLLEEREHES